MVALNSKFHRGFRVFSPSIIHHLINKGTDGFWYDFSKTDRTFQNVSGLVTAADDAGEAIGTALDSAAWRGATLDQIAEFVPDVLSTKVLTSWSFTNASGSFARTATTLHFGGAGDLTYRVSASVGVADICEATFLLSGTGDVRIFGLGGSGSVLGVTGITLSSTPTFYKVRYLVNNAGGNAGPGIQGAAAGTPADVTVYDVQYRVVPGHSAIGSGTVRPTRQSGGVARFDGINDGLLGDLAPASAMTLIAKAKNIADNGSPRIVLGSQAGANTGSFIGFDGNGLVAAGVGAHDMATINSGVDASGLTGVIALTYDGTTVKLYWEGTQYYSAAQSGTPNTTIPYMLGALNNNGTAASFANTDLHQAAAIAGYAATASEIAAVTSYLAAN